MTSFDDLDPARKQRLHDIQRALFLYFVREADPATGLIADKTAPGAPCSIAATGMALTTYPIGVERGFMRRAEAAARVLTSLRALATAEQSPARNASGHHGFFYHYLDMTTGRRAGTCELSSLDTAILMAGVLTSGAYFRADTPHEAELRTLAELLYARVDWAWMLGGGDAICHGWTPERGFKRWHYRGYSEALILYVLALGSPSVPVPAETYEAWLATYRWRRLYGVAHLQAGPLFVHQLPQIWLDLRGLRDCFMRDHDCDYFENSRRATLVHRAYAIRNPRRHAAYGPECWGLSASDGPGRSHPNGRRCLDYAARGAPFGPDDGTIAPWTAVAALPFAPEIALPAIDRLLESHPAADDPARLALAFNPGVGWVSTVRFGIENYRSGLVWSLLRGCDAVQAGLRRADFRPA
jgi:hypothetical protein